MLESCEFHNQVPYEMKALTLEHEEKCRRNSEPSSFNVHNFKDT